MAKKAVDPNLLALISAGAATTAQAQAAADAGGEGGEGGDGGAAKPGEGGEAAKPGEGGEAAKPGEGGEAAKPGEGGGEGGGEGAAAAAQPSAQVTELMAHLKTENARLNEDSTRSKIKLEEANARITALTAEQEPLLKIVRASCETMGIALNSENPALATLSSKDVVELHTKLSGQLVKRFPVGGKATATAETQTPPGEAAPQSKSAGHSAAVAATRIGPK